MTNRPATLLALITSAVVVSIAIGLIVLSAGSQPQTAIAGGDVALTWGDIDCDGAVSTIDALKGLRDIAALPINQEPDCPEIGSDVGAAGAWGDWDCNQSISAIDQLQLLRHIAALSTSQAEGCPEFGGGLLPTVTVSELTIEPDWRDYGDAPDGTDTGYASGAAIGSFPTLPANSGPSHPFPFTVWLGEFATMEPEPYVGTDADDGLQILDLAACDDSSALVVINRGGLSESELDDPVYVNLLADWNGDGDWSDEDGCEPEWAVENLLLDLSESGDALDAFAVEFPGGDQVDEFWLRLVVSSTPFDPAVGGEIEGETEDYFVSGGELPGSAGPSSPVTKPDLAGNSFVCRGVVVPHGPGASAIFQIDQTAASKKDKFTPRSVNLKTSQPLSVDGKAAGGVTSTGLSVAQPALVGGRLVMQVTATINTTKDAPERLEGPFILTVFIDGKDSKNKSFGGSLPCSFNVDHTADATAFDPSIDGFIGGPGRASKAGDANPKFLIVPHGKKITLLTDAPISKAELAKGKYDKSSLTVFNGKGDKVDLGKLKEQAGIKKIRVPKSGSGIKIETVRDNRKPPVERIVIRLSGVDSADVPFTDYYRIVIIHEKGKKARSLVSDLNDKFVMLTQEEDEPYEVAYASDGDAIHSVIPAGDGLVWDPEIDCAVSGGGSLRGIMRGSRAFIFDYAAGGSDIFILPDPSELTQTSGVGPSDCPNDATNLTNFGAGSPFTIERGNRCDSKFLATEFTPDGFDVFEVGAPPLPPFPQPVSGGDSIRSPHCFSVDGNGTLALVGSTPGDEDRSNLVYLPLIQCGGTCTQNSHEPTLLMEAANPNEHLVSAAVSPDGTKIAFDYVSPTGSQIWVGDFDPQAPAITNAAAITSEGSNKTPTWSPDGQQIAFVSDRDGNSEIYVMNADGSDQQNITNTPNVSEFDPSWMTP